MTAAPFDETYLRAAARLADLDVPDDRVEALVEAGGPIQAMFRSIADLDLGETPPATAFSAGWE